MWEYYVCCHVCKKKNSKDDNKIWRLPLFPRVLCTRLKSNMTKKGKKFLKGNELQSFDIFFSNEIWFYFVDNAVSNTISSIFNGCLRIPMRYWLAFHEFILTLSYLWNLNLFLMQEDISLNVCNNVIDKLIF